MIALEDGTQDEDTHRASRIIQEKGHERDLYHAALMNHSRQGRVDVVEEIAAAMKQNDVAWNSHTYNLLLTACAKRKDTRMAARYFEMMRKEQLAPDAQIYATMITLLARNGRAKEAWQLLQQSCQGEEVRSEWRTFQVLMERAIEADDLSRAEEALALAKRVQLDGLKNLYDDLIQAYACRENIKRIRQLIDEMLETGIYVRPFVQEMLRKYEERDQLLG